MSYSVPVNIAILIAFVIFSLYILGIHNIVTSSQKNDCEMTFMFQYPQFVEISLPNEIHKAYPKYALYGYGEGGITEQLRKMNFKGIPVLFIPGSRGSYKQGRSLASVSLRKSLKSRTPFHFNYFMIDFNEEQSAVFGGVLEDQTKFALHCIKKILSLYDNNEKHKRPDSVVLIGHSMGGLLAKGVFMAPEFDSKIVRLLITMAAPHKFPLYQPDYYITSYYRELKNFWKNRPHLNNTFVISIGGGPKDIVVHSDVTSDPSSDINVLTTAVPGVWLSNDHLSIMWCKQLVITIIRSIFDCVDVTTKQLTTDKDYMKEVFKYHFLKRSAGKKFSGSLMSRFSSFEKSVNWFENLQRQFTVTEPKGLNANHYIMIRLFSDPKSEAAFIEAFNVNVKDWIFVCSADIVYNSIRMCDTGENISNKTEIAPVNLSLNFKRKFVYLNLHELKAKSFSHVVIRLPPSGAFMSVNVDVHQPADRNIRQQVPKYYSFFPETVIEKTQENVAYYSVNLLGFECIWQSFIVNLKVLSCKSEKNHAVASFVTPWSNEDIHFIFQGKNSLAIPLNLVTPKPRNFNLTSFPYLNLHLDPTCKYQATIQFSIVGMFSQGARYYSFMLPAFIATVALLTLRQQMKHLDEDKCVLLQSALSAAVRPYYVVLQVSVFGSKILGLGFLLSVLPEPDFLALQEQNLDSFFFPVLLYAVAIVLTYSLGTALYVSVIISGQAAQKMALRLEKFIAKSISGVFNWSEWVIATLHQVPFLVAAILISLSASTTGALSLWLGVFFYFLKLCKMYEEYLEGWFHYSLKMLAIKIKELILRKPPKVLEIQKLEEEITDRNSEEVDKEKDKSDNPQSGAVETVPQESESETDLLAAIHFHVTILMIWVLTALLYVPSLLIWVKSYYYSTHLEKDPALVPSIIINACGVVLWQQDVPRQSKKLARVTSSSLFALAIMSIIYASLSVYRLGFILSATFLVVTLNQVLSKYI